MEKIVGNEKMTLWISDASLRETHFKEYGRYCSIVQSSLYKIKKSCGYNRAIHYSIETALHLNFYHFHQAKCDKDKIFTHLSVMDKAINNLLNVIPEKGFELLLGKVRTMKEIVDKQREYVLEKLGLQAFFDVA